MSWHDITVPKSLNTGPWATAYTWPALAERIARDTVILPICSIGIDPRDLANLGPLILPPLFQEAMDRELRDALVERIKHCFPYMTGSGRRAKTPGRLEIVELPKRAIDPPKHPRLLAFSMDTAVEEHGPHLPL